MKRPGPALGANTAGFALLEATAQVKGAHSYTVCYRGNAKLGPSAKTVRVTVW